MKNSTMKRLLAGALSAAMIFTSMPANFLAEEVNQTAEEAVIAAEEGAAEEAAAGETGAELADALYDEGIQMPDSSPETGEDAGLIADADTAEFSEALTESDEEIVDSLDEFEEIEEFIVDEEMVLEEEVLFDEEYAEPETDSFEDEWIDESAIALEEDPEISEGEVLLTTDKTHLDTGETFEFSIQAPGAE